MKRSRRKGLARERILMIASSVLVLASLTAAGIWLRRDDSSKDEGYVVDLNSIENSTAAGVAEQKEVTVAENVAQGASTDDLDYDPYFQETNSQKVENPDQSESESMSEPAEQENEETGRKPSETGKVKDGQKDGQKNGDTEAALEEADTTALSTAMQPALTFTDSDSLVWPVVGNILINYSMDKTVYFSTLQQYKYNPAVVIQANEGDLITAASSGKVISVFTDNQIGNGVTMELGGGYEATYGQLKDILVSEGSFVAAGDVIAQVAAPTKYYSVEGPNVYFKLTKDGEPVNPLSKLN